MSPSRTFRWSTSPTVLAAKLDRADARIKPAIQTLGKSHAARAEATMKTGASWTDQTGFARAALFARYMGDDNMVHIEIGTTNLEYGIFLELGTIYMAPRPIIEPTYRDTAEALWRDAIILVGGLLRG